VIISPCSPVGEEVQRELAVAILVISMPTVPQFDSANYSYLNATIGSTIDARRAGIHAAVNVTADITIATAA